MTAMITKGEREDLQRLVRQREKVLKSAAKQRSSELIADFENQLGAIYAFDNDATWAAAVKAAKAEVARANKTIAARSAALGIPKDFAPSVEFHWYGRGYNGVKERRAELRKMATTRIEAIQAKAITEIELASVEAQTQIAASGLTSEAARAFLDNLPRLETLMPKLSFEEVAGKAAPPVAEQLTSPGALRQRRFRERHHLASQAPPAPTAALRDAEATLRDGPESDGPSPAEEETDG